LVFDGHFFGLLTNEFVQIENYLPGAECEVSVYLHHEPIVEYVVEEIGGLLDIKRVRLDDLIRVEAK
jgi:hypothetical protein